MFWSSLFLRPVKGEVQMRTSIYCTIIPAMINPHGHFQFTKSIFNSLKTSSFEPMTFPRCHVTQHAKHAGIWWENSSDWLLTPSQVWHKYDETEKNCAVFNWLSGLPNVIPHIAKLVVLLTRCSLWVVFSKNIESKCSYLWINNQNKLV